MQGAVFARAGYRRKWLAFLVVDGGGWGGVSVLGGSELAELVFVVGELICCFGALASLVMIGNSAWFLDRVWSCIPAVVALLVSILTSASNSRMRRCATSETSPSCM